MEPLEDPSLLYSGSKALTLKPDQEGEIFTEKAIAEIEFYVAENTDVGKIEARGIVAPPPTPFNLFLLPQYVVTRLPTSINPDIGLRPW